MTFDEKLTEYMTKSGCSNKELSEISGLSAATIGRYKSGKRKPKLNSSQLEDLANGIYHFLKDKDSSISSDDIFRDLKDALDNNFDYDSYISKIKIIMDTLSISNVMLAKTLKYDPSYVSRILSGQRKIYDISDTTEKLSHLIAKRTVEMQCESQIAEIIGAEEKDAAQTHSFTEYIAQWLVSGTIPKSENSIKKFLTAFDDFDLDEYINVLHFKNLKVPSLPFLMFTSRKCTGLKEMMNCEIDFLKMTVSSKSMENVTIYSEMPMEEMSKDSEFPKKWMFGTAMMLKKGLRLNMIHNLNRPFDEMMLGLESYIPLYMTGQISPYYLTPNDNSIFLNHLKVSGAAVLVGDAIKGHHQEGRYFLTNNKEEMAYYKRKANLILSKAKPLMEIYNSSADRRFNEYFFDSFKIPHTRKMILNSPPVFTLSDELADSLLTSRNINTQYSTKIKSFIEQLRHTVIQFLNENKLTIVIPEMNEETFRRLSPALSVPEIFIDGDIHYTYEEYQAHLQQTKDFACHFPNFMIETQTIPDFKNIKITIIEDKEVIVSKSKSPVIHFVIKHPKMTEAFQNYSSPVIE